MSDSVNDRTGLLLSLKSLTRKALSQAKIDHMDGLTLTLARREQLILQIYGLESEERLPSNSPEDAGVQRPAYSDDQEVIVADIRTLDSQLMTVLEHNKDRIQQQMQQLSDGGNYIRNVKTLYQNPIESQYLDQVG